MFWLDDPFSSRFGGFGGFGGGFDGYGPDRRGFAPVSQRAQAARDQAFSLFLDFLTTADTSKGAATAEIIQFHMVPDMRKSFSKYVKQHKCTATSRQLTRAEQDKINPNRKSLIWYTSVTVTPAAQKEFLEKNPSAAEKTKAKREAVSVEKHASQASEVSQTAQPQASGSSSKKRKAESQPKATGTGSKAKKVKA